MLGFLFDVASSEQSNVFQSSPAALKIRTKYKTSVFPVNQHVFKSFTVSFLSFLNEYGFSVQLLYLKCDFEVWSFFTGSKLEFLCGAVTRFKEHQFTLVEQISSP